MADDGAPRDGRRRGEAQPPREPRAPQPRQPNVDQIDTDIKDAFRQIKSFRYGFVKHIVVSPRVDDDIHDLTQQYVGGDDVKTQNRDQAVAFRNEIARNADFNINPVILSKVYPSAQDQELFYRDILELIIRGGTERYTNEAGVPDASGLLDAIKSLEGDIKNVLKAHLSNDNASVIRLTTQIKDASEAIQKDADEIMAIKNAGTAITILDDNVPEMAYDQVEKLEKLKLDLYFLKEELEYNLASKLPPKVGGARATIESARDKATAEKVKELREEVEKQQLAIVRQQESIDRQIVSLRQRLVDPLVTPAQVKEATDKIAKLNTETEEIIKKAHAVDDKLTDPKVENWFQIVETKTEDYVQMVRLLYEKREKRVDAEETAKKLSVEFLALKSIDTIMTKTVDSLKEVSGKKCERIGSLREVYRSMKEIEKQKLKLVENAALMLNPSRGVANFSQDSTSRDNASRIRNFDKIKGLLQEEYSSLLRKYPSPAAGRQVAPTFKTDFKEFAPLIAEVGNISGMYGTDPNSDDNRELVTLRAHIEDYNTHTDAKGESTFQLDNLYDQFFTQDYNTAIRILERQKTLLMLTTDGGDLVRQEVDRQERVVSTQTERVLAEYTKLKALPKEIDVSQEKSNKIYDEEYEKAIKQKKDSIKDELEKIKKQKEEEKEKIQKLFKEDVDKLKNEPKQVQNAQRGKEDYSAMTDEQLQSKKAGAEVGLADMRKKLGDSAYDEKKKKGLPDQIRQMQQKLDDINREISRRRKATGGGGFKHHKTIRKIH